MPELRQNLATKEWVIIASERAQRPDEFKTSTPRPASPAKDASCPFCPGNESMSQEVSVLGGAKDWRVRVIMNRFPALVPNATRPLVSQSLYRRLPGEGIHEVIVESPSHNAPLALLQPSQVADVLAVYRERFKASLGNDKIALTLIFKNHGEAAGVSLGHPHSQLVGSTVVPHNIRHRMDEAQKYYEQNDACVHCRMIEEEKRQGARLLADTPHFTAFILFAALSPFHLWILPKRHMSSFSEISDVELADMASVLQGILKKIHKGLDDPAYNFIIQSAPLDRGTTEPFHWYLSLVVRLGKAAGFELGSGMYINTSIPEDSARFLNAVKV